MALAISTQHLSRRKHCRNPITCYEFMTTDSVKTQNNAIVGKHVRPKIFKVKYKRKIDWLGIDSNKGPALNKTKRSLHKTGIRSRLNNSKLDRRNSQIISSHLWPK